MIHPSNLEAYEQLLKILQQKFPQPVIDLLISNLNDMSEAQQEVTMRKFIYTQLTQDKYYKRVEKNKLHAVIPPECYQKAWDYVHGDINIMRRVNYAIKYLLRTCFRIKYTYDELFSQALHIIALSFYRKNFDFTDCYAELNLIESCEDYTYEEKRFLKKNIYAQMEEWNKIIIGKIWGRFIMMRRRQFKKCEFTNIEDYEYVFGTELARRELHKDELMLVEINKYVQEKILDPRKTYIFEMSYLKGYLDKEIAEQIGYSPVYVAALRKEVIHVIVENRVYIAEKILGIDVNDMPDEIGDAISWNHEYNDV